MVFVFILYLIGKYEIPIPYIIWDVVEQAIKNEINNLKSI